MLDINKILMNNPNAPTNDEYAINFARKLLPPKDKRNEKSFELNLSQGIVKIGAEDTENTEWCGEYTIGLLHAVLSSNLISEKAKTEIMEMMADSQPSLEMTKTVGHFRFHWTETSADNRDNVTEADIDATASVLNDCWDLYTINFQQPKANLINGTRLIEVNVYYSPGLYGSTASQLNSMFLNSLHVVRDDCRRQTTPVHELFHRLQYSYGYITGTGGQTWWVEGTAAWSQDLFNDNINDYVSRVNSGLNTPDSSLLNRSYDACHYWKYITEQLNQRSSDVTSEAQAMREFLDEYNSNGLNAQAASGTVTQQRLGKSMEFFFQDWSKANYIKDLDNPYIRYEYTEDDIQTNLCGRQYGPYTQVAPVMDETVPNNSWTWASQQMTVQPFGTDYLLFRLKPEVDKITIRFEGNPTGGNGDFCLHLIMIKGNRWSVIYNNYNNTTERTWNLNFNAGQYDKAVLVVNGLHVGGSYKVSVNACLSGIWKDNYNFVWKLVQSGNMIQGRVTTRLFGGFPVKGEIHNNDVELNVKTGGFMRSCDFKIQGKVEACKEIKGTWTNSCKGKGKIYLVKTTEKDALMLHEAEDIEIADDPTIMRE